MDDMNDEIDKDATYVQGRNGKTCRVPSFEASLKHDSDTALWAEVTLGSGADAPIYLRELVRRGDLDAVRALKARGLWEED